MILHILLKEKVSDSVTTLTMVHDINGILFLCQSLLVLILYLNHINLRHLTQSFLSFLIIFSRIPTSLGMDFKDKLIKFLFDDSGDSVNYQGLYLSSTTPSRPSQSLAVFLNKGLFRQYGER